MLTGFLVFSQPLGHSNEVAAQAFSPIVADTLEPSQITLPDTLSHPTESANSEFADTTYLTQRYLPASPLRTRRSTLRHSPSLLSPSSGGPALRVEADTLYETYFIHPSWGRSGRTQMDRESYLVSRRDRDMRINWREIQEERAREREMEEATGLGMNIAIPGGHESPFSTIFGSPEVDLRVTGDANIDAGLNYRRSDEQTNITGSPTQIDPDFRQDLRLGISGTIGDKLLVDVNWDTNNQFDFQNQVRLQYTGYDDEILQSVEAGNVFLQTPSSLIRGGQSLFGIKSELQFGGLNLTTIASQQEGQTGSLTIEGGAEQTNFSLLPTDYDERTHFFLSYFFRNNWETALANPPNVQLPPGYSGITDIEVWRLQTSANPEDEDIRSAVAVVDLGEPEEILTAGRDFQEASLNLFRQNADQYSDADLTEMRQADTGRSFFEARGLRESDYETGYFMRLEPGDDFNYNDNLGYLSLRQRLQDGEALAIAVRYNQGGETFQIGDLTGAGGTSGGVDEERLALKLLRPSRQTQPSAGQGVASWYLQMRNIYNLRGRNLDQGDFELDIFYDPPSQTPVNTLAEMTGANTLLTSLGLDRLTNDGAQRPNDEFDFLTGITIDPSTGLLIFPYLEPFGQRIEELLDEQGELSDATRDQYVFESLYQERRENAERNTNVNVYRIEGSYSGSAQDYYDLRAIGGLVEGSVRVTSGGQTLQEGVDFSADYQGGTVTILNESHLRSGRTVNIDYEQNALYNIQQKTLLGARADYAIRNDMSVGATMMRLSERSPVDKYRIGEEPISNLLWGVDGAMDLDTPWLTRALDALPVFQTSASSHVSLSGEFAQLRPGHNQTTAFDRTRRDLRGQDRDFQRDELGGISYLDDFEGFERSLSLSSRPQEWQISSSPQGYLPPGYENAPATTVHDSLRTPWRGTLGWYQLNQSIIEELEGRAQAYDSDAVRLIDIQEVFPNRDTRGEINTTLRTLDLYFDPHMRGPYNYQDDLHTFMDNPEHTWGGMIRRLPDSYSDFSVQNVEFIEFIFKPYPENVQEDPGANAALYLDLGSISEDIIGNERLSTEDGLSLSNFSPTQFDGPFRLATRQQLGTINIENGRTNDLGIDGLVSYNPDCYDSEGRYTECIYPEIVTEHHQFSGYLDRIRSIAATNPQLSAEINRTLSDPSADEYHHYGNDAFFNNEDYFPDGASFQQRFSRYHSAMELKSFEAQNTLADHSTLARGVTREPSTEDLNRSGVLDTENSYFQYRIPLSRDSLEAQARSDDPRSYVVGEIEGEDGTGTGWYQVRVPVRRYTDTIGNIQDFSRIEHLRMWTAGHRDPITMRFAKMDLVGSQWRTSERLPLEENARGEALQQPTEEESPVFISSVNNEENSDIYVPPPRAVIGQERTATGTRRNAREQSMVLQVEDLRPGRQRGVFKTFTQGLNLLRYGNLRMFTRMHGTLSDGTDLAELAQRNRSEAREQAHLFVRIGSNQTSDYYEYEQPLTPSRLGETNPDSLWLPEENEMQLVLSALNQLKVARDDSGYPRDQVFRSNQIEALQVGVPNPEAFAPEGTRLAIRGNPSLQSVNNIVIGVRNPNSSATGQSIENVTLWLDELRVTDYDEESGWAAIADTDIRLADVGRISGNLRTQTHGFGSLSSSLAERQQDDIMDWSVTTDLYLDSFLPERYGWNIPLTFQMQSQTATPRFSPQRGDVRLEEIFAQIDANADLSEAEKQEARDQALRRAQNHRTRHSFTASVQKNNSDSWFLRNTLDGITLNYSFSSADGRSPSQLYDNNWNWNTNLQYRLDVSEPRTFRPMGFLSELPILGAIGRIDFNYVPQSLVLSGNAGRRYSINQARTSNLPAAGAVLPEQVRNRHSFSHDRSMTLQYNPFNFLNINFSSNTDESLNTISADTSYVVYSIDDDEVLEQPFTTVHGANQHLAQLPAGGFRQDLIDPIPTGTLLQRLLGGDAVPRPNTHRQRIAATLRLPFFNRQSLDWISVDDIGYQANFRWNNGPLGQALGARVENQLEMRAGMSLHPRRFWERIGIDTSTRPTDEDASAFQPGRWARQALMSVLRLENIAVNYTGNQGARSNHVGRLDEAGSADVSYSIIDALQGSGPSLGYRLGLNRSIPLSDRITSGTSDIRDDLTSGNRVQARTHLQPSQNLQINLTWDLNWNSNRTTSFTSDNFIVTGGGNHSGTVWTFGGSYEDLVERQLELLRSNLDNPSQPEGRTALTNVSLVEDFRDAFTTTVADPLDGRGLMMLPLPSWNVSYTGMSDWPLLGRIAQNISLRHNYSGTMSNNYYLNDSNSIGQLTSFNIAGTDIFYQRPEFRAGGMNVTARFQPMLGLDLTWSNNIQTNISWNVSTISRLSTSNTQVSRNEANELSLNMSYREQGFSLPLIPGRLENQININLTFSVQRDDQRRFSLRRALEEAVVNPADFTIDQATSGDNVSTLLETTLYRFSPRIGYQVSNRVRADFLMQFEHLDGDSRRPSYTNIEGGFNLQVDIAN